MYKKPKTKLRLEYSNLLCNVKRKIKDSQKKKENVKLKQTNSKRPKRKEKKESLRLRVVFLNLSTNPFLIFQKVLYVFMVLCYGYICDPID